MSENIKSPRIERLKKALQKDRPGPDPLDLFWQEIKEKGTPLIEKIPGDPDHILITFLWRENEVPDGAKITTNIVVDCMLGDYKIARNQMSCLFITDLWYKTYYAPADIHTLYNFIIDAPLIPRHELTPEQDEDQWKRAFPDPFNPHKFFWPADPADPESKEGFSSILALPPFLNPPWTEAKPHLKRGEIREMLLPADRRSAERRVWIYTPPHYGEGTGDTSSGDANLLILLDGWAYLNLVRVPLIMDNLFDQGDLTPTIVLFIDQNERMVELACSEDFTDYLVETLLPLVRLNYRVSTDPARTIIGGSSLGGLTASFAGLRHPEIFGGVISQSGAYWWWPGAKLGYTPRRAGARVEHAWLTKQFIVSPLLPLRFYLSVGLLEDWGPSGGTPNLLICNRHIRDILLARGYEVTYQESCSGHDYFGWQATFGAALLNIFHPAGGQK